MAELRWNPLLGTYTMVASNRSHRPHLPKNYCPFCPGSGKVPDEYDVYVYNNDFPALTLTPGEPDVPDDELYTRTANYGKNEVILYSPEHTITLPQLSLPHIRKLIELWVSRNDELSKNDKLKYIFVFENRGEEVGVTMPHPHGQLYAYPFIPLKLEVELQNCRNWYEKEKSCMICEMNAKEKEFQKRMVWENDSYLCYLPFFTDYPYGVFIVPKRHFLYLTETTDKEREDLAEMLKLTTGMFDKLFDKLFPYMMCFHQGPYNSPQYRHASEFYHFHIEFYTPLRDANKIKYYASSEMGAWCAANTKSVEATSLELKDALEKFKRTL